MDIFLKLVGGLALLVVLAIGAVLLFFWWKLRALARGLSTAMPPSTVKLVVEPEPKWAGEGPVKLELESMAALGYRRGSAYTVEGIAGVSLVALVHPETGVHAACYNHPAAGNWLDLCAQPTGGPELTVTSAPMGQQMDTRPDAEKIYRKARPAAELHALLVEKLGGREVRRVTLETFAAEFEAAYARDMAWRNQKDGTSEEEFRRIAADGRKDFTEEQLREGFKQTKRHEIERRSEEALEAFAKSTTLSVAEWKKHEGRMVIWRESFHPAAYFDYLLETIELSEEDQARYRDALDAGLSLKGLMQRIGTDTGQEFVKLGEVAQPLPVEVYAVTPAPEKPA